MKHILNWLGLRKDKPRWEDELHVLLTSHVFDGTNKTQEKIYALVRDLIMEAKDAGRAEEAGICYEHTKNIPVDFVELRFYGDKGTVYKESVPVGCFQSLDKGILIYSYSLMPAGKHALTSEKIMAMAEETDAETCATEL